MIGRVFSRLTVIAKSERPKHWVCQCACGAQKTVQSANLRSNGTKSCGCLARERITRRNTTHGCAAHSARRTEYRIWSGIKTRCLNPRSEAFARYGGRGVTMCSAWANSFETFLEDMGHRPSPLHTIDRIDNDGPYAKENCRWSDRYQQANNRSSNVRVEINGQCMTMSEAAREYGKTRQHIRDRIEQGWPLSMALLIPTAPYRHGLSNTNKL
jgi:hypothetical protein